MKRIKKLICLSLVVLSLLSFSVPAFAASGLNANEKELYKIITDGVSINGRKFSVLDSYANDVYNYLNRDDVDLKKSQTDEAIRLIKETYQFANDESLLEIVGNRKEIDLNILPYATKRKILDNGIAAAAACDLVLTYEKATNTVVIVDAKGTQIFKNEPIIKTTGSTAQYTAIYAVGGVCAVLFLGAVVVVIMRKKIFA